MEPLTHRTPLNRDRMWEMPDSGVAGGPDGFAWADRRRRTVSPLSSRTTVSRRSSRFWRELFIYAWVASLVGTWYELVLSLVLVATTGDQSWWRPTEPWRYLTFAEPYGLGLAAVILIVVPARERFGLAPPVVFVFNGVVTAATELVCAQILVLALGHNPFWNYSNLPFGFGGYSSLASASVFGAFATIFVYGIYAPAERLLDRLSERAVWVVCAVLLVLYLAGTVLKLASLGWLAWPPR